MRRAASLYRTLNLIPVNYNVDRALPTVYCKQTIKQKARCSRQVPSRRADVKKITVFDDFGVTSENGDPIQDSVDVRLSNFFRNFV